MKLGCTILHLEDDDDDSFLFARALEGLRFSGTYRRVTTAEEVIEYLSRAGIFADTSLYPCPEIFVTDGTATAPKLASWLNQNAEFRHLKRFVLTGGMREADQAKWVFLGFDCVLPKGGSFEEMTSSVKFIIQ